MKEINKSKLFKDLKIDYDNVIDFYEYDTIYKIKIKGGDRWRIYDKETLKEMFKDLWEIIYLYENNTTYYIELKWEDRKRIYDKETLKEIK